MELDLYRRRAGETALFPERGDRSKNAINYCLVGLAGETGETLNKWKKILRGDKPLDEAACLAFAKELGGVLWYLSQAAWEFGWDFDDITRMNLNELKDRSVRGVIQGDGDNR